MLPTKLQLCIGLRGFRAEEYNVKCLQTDDGSNDGNSSRSLWQRLLKSFDEYQGDNTNSNMTSFFRFLDKRVIYRWYNLVHTCAGECDWLFHWQHKWCVTLSANVNINYRLPIKVYYRICNLCHTLNRCKVAYFHGKRHDSYSMQWRKVRYLIFMDHATKEWEVANFHGQASDAYAYVWMVQGSLFSWITLWNLCHTLNRCKVAYFHGTHHDSYSMQWRKVR